LTGFSGKYRLDARLGGGGMAEVFLGSTLGAEGFSRRVAIKRVLPGFSENPQFATMFIDEARISSRLVHPNIVSVVDFDRDAEGRLYLVMELVEGKDLDGLGTSGPLPVPVVLYVISEVLRGLGHAHDLPIDEHAMHTGAHMRGIVHRDVSPHNVLLSWEGTVKVSDFGIAKARTASEATASVLIKGKPAYMSPEQANGEKLDGRSDLFAVGVMLWELLVGRRLFVGEDTRATLAAVLFGQIPRPRSLRTEIPKDVERVVMKLLERDLPARYATAEAAIADLLECDVFPKDGRELLKRTLAERFPQHAPVRHSAMRSRGATTPPHSIAFGSGDVPVHDRQTIADGNVGRGGPAHPMPSLGEMRGAQTATMQPQQPAARPIPRRSGRKVLVAVVAGLVTGIAILVVVAATSNRSKAPATTLAAPEGPARGSGDGSEGSAGGAAAPEHPVPPPVDAGAGSAEQTLPPDAGAPEAKKDATGHRPSEKRMGRLKVTAYPIVTVYVDNAKVHDTPVDMKLPVGKHKLRLVNSDNGIDETRTVTIDENKPTIIERN
jgi:serine/threonine protein kinase